MPNHTTPAPGPDADDYTWPTCTACGRNLFDTEIGRHACRICQDRAAQHLTDIGNLFPHLNTTHALTPTVHRSTSTPGEHRGGGTGGRAAPIPLRLDTLNLTAGGGAATRLCAIEDAWRLALGRRIPVRRDTVRVFAAWRANPAADVPEHVNFLRINLERACESYPEVADDLNEIRRIHGECRAALDPGARGRRIAIGPCPITPAGATQPCGTPLTATTANHRVRCGTCGTRWDGLADWRDLRLAQKAATRRTALAA